MKKIICISCYLLTLLYGNLNAQTLYIDAEKGDDLNSGTQAAPFQSLSRAVSYANTLTGAEAITIKLNPGLYLLSDKIDINPVKILNDSTRYIVEATLSPDDAGWTPEKMPVIQSVSFNNSNTQFPHACGLLIAAEHITIRGLKFLGNANPMVDYYYPIAKEDLSLSDLEVSQCIFIGDKEGAKIQGGVWAHGPDNKVSHCVFYGCRNGVLFFNNVAGFTIEHSIVYGAYESAFWFGPEDYQFTFTNNIIANNAYFLVGPKDLKYSSPFSNSIMSNNHAFVGYWSREEQKVMPLSKPEILLEEVKSNVNLEINENNHVRLERNHLHFKRESSGQNLRAGIFKNAL